MRKVYLHGALGDRFGREPFELDAHSYGVLFSGISSYHPGFREEFRRHGAYYIIKSVKGKPSAVRAEELALTIGAADEVHLIPNVQGAFETAAAALITAVAGAAAATATAVAVVSAVLYIATSIALSYLAASLAGSPDGGSTGRPEDRQSALFTRAENVAEQGGPVPLVYGRFRVGSTVINVGISTEDVAV